MKEEKNLISVIYKEFNAPWKYGVLFKQTNKVNSLQCIKRSLSPKVRISTHVTSECLTMSTWQIKTTSLETMRIHLD